MDIKSVKDTTIETYLNEHIILIFQGLLARALAIDCLTKVSIQLKQFNCNCPSSTWA